MFAGPQLGTTAGHVRRPAARLFAGPAVRARPRCPPRCRGRATPRGHRGIEGDEHVRRAAEVARHRGATLPTGPTPADPQQQLARRAAPQPSTPANPPSNSSRAERHRGWPDARAGASSHQTCSPAQPHAPTVRVTRARCAERAADQIGEPAAARELLLRGSARRRASRGVLGSSATCAGRRTCPAARRSRALDDRAARPRTCPGPDAPPRGARAARTNRAARADEHVRRPHGPAVARDLGNAADMFVGLAPRGGPGVTLDLGSAADMFVGLAPRGAPR